jgi:thioredoxin reductase/SAM-dependent methyltransferase
MTREQTQMPTSATVDVAVIGGGAAGLSAAMVLGRVRRSVVVIDAGAPRNARAEGVHGFLSRDGIAPAELIDTGRREVEHYGGVVRHAEARAARRTATGFEITLDDGSLITARRLLATTGLVDELPDLPGVRERWGRDVLHCPYCHGWEVRDQPVGILGTGPRAVHQALLFRQLTADLVLFTNTAPALTDEEVEQLAALDVRVVDGTVDSLEVVDDRLTGVRLSDGTVIARRAVAVTPRFVASSQVLATLGLRPVPHPLGMGEFIAADPTGLTEVPGVWVAGNVTDLVAQVVTAAAGGVAAAAAINADLIAEDTQRAVTARRMDHQHAQDLSAMFTEEFWNERYSSVDSVWSGKANPHLVATAAELAPTTALDVGSGEGADAIWLAAKGWRVTGVDVSTVALDRAAKRAADLGDQIADRITWQQADVLSWDPAPLRFDLVSAQFMHLPKHALESLHRRLAAAVRPGGTLLIVGHHPSDVDTAIGRPAHLRELMFTTEQIVAVLDPDDWHIVTTEPERQVVVADGRSITIRDAVLRATRRH